MDELPLCTPLLLSLHSSKEKAMSNTYKDSKQTNNVVLQVYHYSLRKHLYIQYIGKRKPQSQNLQ